MYTEQTIDEASRELEVEVTLSREEATSLWLELKGALSFLEQDARIGPTDGPTLRELMLQLEGMHLLLK